MDLKKRKHFSSKKEDNFLMSFFLFLFLISNREDLALVKVYNAEVRCFLKTFTKRLLGKNKSSQKFHKCYSSRNEALITLVNFCDKRVSVCQGCKGLVKSNWLPFPPPYSLVAATKMRREYFTDRKKELSGHQMYASMYFTRIRSPFHSCMFNVV